MITVQILQVPGYETIRDKFEDLVPFETKIELDEKPGEEPIDRDQLEMIVNQYKQTVLPNKRYQFQPEITVVDLRGKSRTNQGIRDSLKVFVEGPNQEKRNINDITSELEQFIKKELQNMGPPSETIQHKCRNMDKADFKIAQFLTSLKLNSQGVIKSFDVSKDDIVEVVYSKIETPNFSWRDIKNQVEEQMIHYVRFQPKSYGGDEEGQQTQDDMNALLSQFLVANPFFSDNINFPNIKMKAV